MDNIREYKSWRNRYDEIVKFKKRTNRLPSLRPSAAGTNQYVLASWLARQRKNKRSGILSKRQIELLESIGVVWNPTKENKSRWEGQLQKLIEFRKNNHDRWPSKDSKDKRERTIAFWCHNNRMWYQGKLKEVGEYPEYRKNKLDKIGFLWFPDARNKRWQKKYEELKRYRQTNPNRWPPVRMYPLYKWLFKQKMRYRSGVLPNDRIELLNKLGVEWNINESHRVKAETKNRKKGKK
ncbi:MAG: helicase associated domain-containing protein [Deltaproteobacteria bacterium]|nr:helicase associated domain-containing protein [Deltaproteobacteria bacterium]